MKELNLSSSDLSLSGMMISTNSQKGVDIGNNQQNTGIGSERKENNVANHIVPSRSTNNYDQNDDWY